MPIPGKSTAAISVRHPCQRENRVLSSATGRGSAARHRGDASIVLSSEEHAAAQAKFGPIYATRYDVLMTNRAGDLAFVIWSAQWRGGEAIVEIVDGEWEFSILSTWIT